MGPVFRDETWTTGRGDHHNHRGNGCAAAVSACRRIIHFRLRSFPHGRIWNGNLGNGPRLHERAFFDVGSGRRSRILLSRGRSNRSRDAMGTWEDARSWNGTHHRNDTRDARVGVAFRNADLAWTRDAGPPVYRNGSGGQTYPYLVSPAFFHSLPVL